MLVWVIIITISGHSFTSLEQFKTYEECRSVANQTENLVGTRNPGCIQIKAEG